MTTTGPSDAELAKQYWRKQAQHLRAQLEEANPTMKPTGGTAVKPWKQVEDAAISGASSRAFLTAFQGDNAPSGIQKVSPAEVASSKARIVESLVQQGKDAAYIEDVMNRVSPHLDIFAMTSDPAVQSVLLQRLVNGNSSQNFGLKDLIEATKLIHDVRNTPQQPQSDPASVMNAAGNLFRTGVETARNNNSDMGTIQALYAEMSKQQQANFDRHLALMKERYSEQPSFQDQLQQIVTLQNTLGKLSGKESDAIASKRMDIELERWRADVNARTEERKSKNQGAMIKQITDGLRGALESPVIRQAGEGIGRALAQRSPTAGGVVSAVTSAPAAAARQELSTPPTEVPWGLTCGKCHKRTIFSQLALAKIEDSGGRWTCDCGEVYVLKSNNGPGEGSSP